MHLVVMAGAIEDDCLGNECKPAADKAHTLSSREDWVLQFASSRP